MPECAHPLKNGPGIFALQSGVEALVQLSQDSVSRHAGDNRFSFGKPGEHFLGSWAPHAHISLNHHGGEQWALFRAESGRIEVVALSCAYDLHKQ